MKIVIDIPEEQIKKSLEESKHIHEDEGEKGFVDIMMLYTNGQLDFVDVSRKTDFYSCKYKILQKGDGDLISRKAVLDCIGMTSLHYDLARRLRKLPIIPQTDSVLEDIKRDIEKLPRIKVGNSNSPTVKYCIDERLIYEVFEKHIALKNEQTDVDLISRRAVLDVIEREEFKGDAISEIEKLPSVTPQSKIGHWISLDDFHGKYNENGFICSECSEHSDFEENFCPGCGAKMTEESEEN